MRVQAVFGGVSFQMQERAIRSGVHILVATPGRALDHIRSVVITTYNHRISDQTNSQTEPKIRT